MHLSSPNRHMLNLKGLVASVDQDEAVLAQASLLDGPRTRLYLLSRYSNRSAMSLIAARHLAKCRNWSIKQHLLSVEFRIYGKTSYFLLSRISLRIHLATAMPSQAVCDNETIISAAHDYCLKVFIDLSAVGLRDARKCCVLYVIMLRLSHNTK